MTNKEEYKLFCEQHPEMPLSAQYWWMNILCKNKEWDVIIIRNDQQEIIATLPYLLVRKMGMKIILQPTLSQTNGIWFANESSLSVEEKEKICSAILYQLKQLHLQWYCQFYDHRFETIQPFESAGYQVTRRRTYVIEDLSDLDHVFSTFTSSKQRHIRKAYRNGLKVDWDMSATAFYTFHTESLLQRGKKNTNSQEVEVSLCEEAMNRGQGAILRVKDAEGNTHAALFIAWNSEAGYYMIPATDFNYKASGASTLVVWEAIKFLQDKTKTFDFEGSMDPAIANSYRQYGTKEIGYPCIEKTNSILIRLWKRLKARQGRKKKQQ